MGNDDQELPPREDSAAVLATTLAIWGAAVALAATEGVFAKLSPDGAGAVAAFIVAFALGAYRVDARLRALAATVKARSLFIAAVAADLGALAWAGKLVRGEAPWLVHAASPDLAFATYFVVPVALALSVAAAERVATLRRSAPAKSPGARPVAL